jgi:hypothetical protein
MNGTYQGIPLISAMNIREKIICNCVPIHFRNMISLIRKMVAFVIGPRDETLAVDQTIVFD